MWFLLKYSSAFAINLIKLIITVIAIGAFVPNYKRIVYSIYTALCDLRFFSIFRLRCSWEVYDNVGQYILAAVIVILIWMLYESFSALIPKKK